MFTKIPEKTFSTILYKIVVQYYFSFSRNQQIALHICWIMKQGQFTDTYYIRTHICELSVTWYPQLKVWIQLMYCIRFTIITLNSKLRTKALWKSTLHTWHSYCSSRGTATLPIQILLSKFVTSSYVIQLRKIRWEGGNHFGITNLLPVKSTIRSSSNHFYFHTRFQNGHCSSWSTVCICSYRTKAMIVIAGSVWTLAIQTQKQSFRNNTTAETIFSRLRSSMNQY